MGSPDRESKWQWCSHRADEGVEYRCRVDAESAQIELGGPNGLPGNTVTLPRDVFEENYEIKEEDEQSDEGQRPADEAEGEGGAARGAQRGA